MLCGARVCWFCDCLCGVAGGCPAATHFSCFAKKSNQKKATRGSSRRQKRRGTLRYSKRRAAAELGLEQLPRNRLRLCSPSNSPRGLPPSHLRYSATLIGACPFRDDRNFSLSSRRRPGPNLTQNLHGKHNSQRRQKILRQERRGTRRGCRHR